MFTSGNQGTIYKIMVAPAIPGLQMDPTAYSPVAGATWTESELIVPTSNFNVWTEITVDLSAYAGFDVYVAFVKEYTQPTASLDGDRWFIDDVGIDLQCSAPVTGTTTAITSTTATLAWTNPGNATSFHVIVTPVGGGTPLTFDFTTAPYTITGLAPNTAYNYTVTGICPTGFSSPPSATSANFTTQVAPPVCGGNLIDSGGPTGNYSNNETVSTTVTPNPGDVATITFTAFNTQAGSDILTIYNGPSNLSPVLATLSGTALPPSFTSTAPGGELTFVFVSNGTTTAAGYAANITCNPAPACRIPTAITASATTITDTTINWTQPTNPDSSVATIFDVIALPQGSPAPTAASTPTFNDVTAAAGPSFVLTGLTSATCYDIYVRAVCTTNSGWSAVATTVCTLVAPPICGGNYVDTGGTTADYPNNATQTSLICPTSLTDAVTIQWTAFNLAAGDNLQVYDGDDTSATLLGTLTGTTLPPSFTSSAPSGCLTLVFTSNATGTAAGWIANVICAPKPTCTAPTVLTTSIVLHNSVTLNWNQPANPDTSVPATWEVYAVPCGSPAPTAASTPTATFNAPPSPPFVLTGLTPLTCYDIYVRAVCGGGSGSIIVGPATINTLAAPPECGGNFVDAGGTTANYAANSNVTTVICPDTPGDVVTVTFTSFNTETNWDALYVYSGNAVVAANLIASNNPPANVPGGLAGGWWGTAIPGPFTSTSADGCLTFVFRSDGSVQNPGWLSNVTCDPPPTCRVPTNIVATVPTSNSVTLNWNQLQNPDNSVATAWEVLALPCGSPAPTAASTGWVPATTNVNFVLTPLASGTCFSVYVRAVCSPTDSSTWGGPVTVTTQVAPPECDGNFVDAGGISANYPANSNVTTTICPSTPGDVVTVTFTSFNTEANWDALYVYDGNAVVAANLIASTNPPANVPGGLAGGWWGTAIPGPFTSSAADGCLTFVFRSDGSVQNPGWVSSVTCDPPPTCRKPTAILNSLVTHDSVTLNWTQPINPDNSVATAWEVLALPCGSPVPTATSTGWVPATTNVNFLLTPLTSATCYDVYIRAVCSPTDSSTWGGPSTFTTLAAPPVCGGNFVDEGGTGANYLPNSNVTTTICPVNPGDVVTVTFTSFNTEANWDALYVYNGNAVVPANLIPSSNPAANVPGGLPGGYWGTALPCPFTSASSDGCLTFVFRSDGSVQNPGWMANITCGPPPACNVPTSITGSNVRHDSVVLDWTQPVNGDGSFASAWQVLALPCGSPAPTAAATGYVNVTTPPAAPPYTLTGLTPLTCYDIYIRANCGATTSAWPCTPVTITTLAVPPTCGEEFTDAGGTTGAYANNSNIPTYICPQSTGDVVTVTFTSFNTDANNDGLYVYDGNAIGVNQISSANGAGAVPGGLPGSYWGNLAGGALPGPFTSTTADGCLTFVFRSNGFTTAPGWVANVTCAPAPTCARPLSITANPITQTTATLNWVQPLNPNGTQATAWQVLVLPAGSGVPTGVGIPVTGTPTYLATGLTAGTTYEFYVRAICGPNDNSIWSGFTFSTPPTNDECANAAFAIVNQNLNCVQTVHGTLVGATASAPPTTCGGAGAADDDVWFTFTATTITHIISFANVTGVPVNSLNYAIYSGSCTGLTEVGCNTGANLTAGTTYYIRVFSDGTGPVPAQFDLCVGTLPCTEAPAFCTGQTVTYDNSTNVPSLGQIGCLFTSPNPAFFFLQVNQAGPLSYLISQVDTGGTPRDVDYVAWGPFTDLNTACTGVPANPLTQTVPIPTPTTGCPGTLHACSYSTAPQEIMCIPNAQLCEVYVIMITNFSNQAGTVTFTQTNSGGGTTACFPINTFNYVPYTFCQNMPNPTPVLSPGAVAGTYSSTPGLVIDPVTGTINLAASTPGTYVVTSTSATTIGGTCNTIPFITTSRTVIITAPANAVISYASASYCNTNTTTQPVIITGDGSTGGTYSATPAGLLINATTGEIIPSASLGGNYTITYTVPAIGGCPAYSTTTQVEIIDAPVPTFTQVAPICPGDALAPLPTSSEDATPITGTWSPAINNMATTTYTFTPDAGQCAETTTMTINVGSTIPTFNAVAPICAGATLAPLPTTSLNGIEGVWSPALDNTQTTTYTFTPTSGVCVGSTTLTIQVLSPTVVPTFNAVPPICPNGTITPLATTSLNGITGVWSPALDNTQTTTYTFTPDTGQCGLTTTLTVVVNPPLVVTVNNPTFCPGSSGTVVATPAIPGTYTYTWTVPDGVADPGNVASFTTTVPGTYSVVIDQVSNFCNTDFESPLATGASPNLVNENLVPCWDTTASDGIIELWPPGFEGVTAYSGNQLIELNANLVGTLFQDFVVIPGTTISVSFAHRGRQGNDVVGVEIGPVGGPYVNLGNFTDGNTAWALHTVNYTIPTGSGNNYTLRFVSVSSTGGDQSIGNLLDSISISSLSCTSAPASGVASYQTLPDPTVTVTQPTCTVQTGTIEVTSPLNVGSLPANLFISEVTDSDAGSLTYIEIFNGTGAPIDLSNYKLRTFNNGASSVTSGCDNTLSGILNNNSTHIVAVGSATNQGGVVPNQVFAGCSGVNIDDNIRLSTTADVDIDIWGMVDGSTFTPASQPGYTYRRNNTAIVPSTTFNAADWTAIDPEDYTNVGSYTLSSSTYEYSLDNGTYQSGTTFSGVPSGTHTITVHNLATGCFSLPFDVTVGDIVGQLPTVTTITYTTPVCQNSVTQELPNTSAVGFTTGGTYSEVTAISTGLVIDPTTGEVNLAGSTIGFHTIQYEVPFNSTTCQAYGVSTFEIEIKATVTPVVGFSYTTPICKIAQATLSPTLAGGFTSGGTFSSTAGLSINGATGVIDLVNSTAGTYTVTYAVPTDASICQVANSDTFTIVITPATTPTVGFHYDTPICNEDTVNPMPILDAGFTTGGVFGPAPAVDPATGEVDVDALTAGQPLTVTYTLAIDMAACQNAANSSTTITKSMPILVELSGGCQNVYVLNATPVGGSFNPETATFSWQNAQGTEVGTSQSLNVPVAGIYTVTVTVDGCSTESDPFEVLSIACQIQKGISVNNDGLNDVFDLTGFDVKKLTIFNRLGMKVYSKANYVNTWGGDSDDGDELPDGTYFYVIDKNTGDSVTGWIYINRAQ
jgi:gliding motility-associated-like protein